jgi:hypothetical protein
MSTAADESVEKTLLDVDNDIDTTFRRTSSPRSPSPRRIKGLASAKFAQSYAKFRRDLPMSAGHGVSQHKAQNVVGFAAVQGGQRDFDVARA